MIKSLSIIQMDMGGGVVVVTFVFLTSSFSGCINEQSFRIIFFIYVLSGTAKRNN